MFLTVIYRIGKIIPECYGNDKMLSCYKRKDSRWINNFVFESRVGHPARLID